MVGDAYTVHKYSMQHITLSSDICLAWVQSAPLHVRDLAVAVHAGFPSPAEDIGAKRIDLTAQLVKHSQATFLVRARGDSMRDAGIFDGDVLVVDSKGLHFAVQLAPKRVSPTCLRAMPPDVSSICLAPGNVS